MQDKAKLELRVKPTQPVQVNRPVVLAIVAVVVLAVLLAIIQAFNVTAKIKAPSSTIKATTDKPLAVSSELNDVPGSYSDVNGIQRYTSGGSMGEITKLQEQLNELKDAYGLLEQQLRARGKQSPEKPEKNPKDEEAKKAPVVFPGLGGGESLISPGADKSDKSGRNPFGQPVSNTTSDLVATKQQGEFYEKQAENNQRLAAMKAAVDKDKPEEIYDLHALVKPISKFQIQAGTIVQATLVTGIDSTIAGTIVAQVRQDLYDTVTGKHLLIPKGSKLLGEYDSRNISYGQRRIAMVFTRIVCPNGNSILLGKPTGADALGQGGVEGSVDNHWARIIGAATISTLLSVGTSMWANKGANDANYRPSVGQNAGAGAAQGFSDVGNQLTSKAMGMAPTITLPPGRPFTVTVKKDMVLAPYKARR
jgi:type IV secretion system protein TrbI